MWEASFLKVCINGGLLATWKDLVVVDLPEKNFV